MTRARAAVALSWLALTSAGCEVLLGLQDHTGLGIDGGARDAGAETGGRTGAGGGPGSGGRGAGGTAGNLGGTGGFGAGGGSGSGGTTAGGAGGQAGSPVVDGGSDAPAGTGGATGTGTGGRGATGGALGTGGASGSGGMGAGGRIGTGGTLTPGTGGAPGTGGTIIGTGGTPGTGGTIIGTGGTPGTGGTIIGPCDVLATAGNPCAAAHSTVRALYGNYSGPLYQVCRGTAGTGQNSCAAGTTQDIGVVAGGYADAASQDTFCAGMTCTISIIYDQSSNANHLRPAPTGGATGGGAGPGDKPASATALATTINGHAVYGVLIKADIGYRAGCTGCATTTAKGTATGDQPETEYMVTSQNGLIDACCFDYGNAETSSNDDGPGTMEAVNFSGGSLWDSGAEGGHSNMNPWVMADLQNGLFAGWDTTQVASTNQTIATNKALHFNFVTAVLVGDTKVQNGGMGRFALYGGDATNGVLTTMYDGIRPTLTGYSPMRKQGSIVLGIAGDNTNQGGGQWFEGVMASGAATLATVGAVQANIVAAGYGK